MNQDNGKMDGAPEVHVGRLSCLTSEVMLTYCITSGALTIFLVGRYVGVGVGRNLSPRPS